MNPSSCLNPSSKKRMAISLAIAVIIAIVFELFVFNYRYWESLFFGPVGDYSVQLLEEEDGTRSIEIAGIDAQVYNLRIQSNVAGSPTKGDAQSVTIYATDEANSSYLALPPTEVVYGIPESEYIRLHLVGKSGTIRVVFSASDRFAPSENSITLNVVRPLFFRPWRLLLVLLLCALIVMFRPSSMLYKHELDLSSRWQQALVLAIASILCGALFLTSLVFHGIGGEESTTNRQYALVAEAIVSGHPWLNLEPPESLASLDNPYDPSARAAATAESDEQPIMDLAYYQGKYYSYFGVVPALLFYVPYTLVTHNYMPTGPLVMALVLVFVPSVLWLLYELVRRHLPSTSIGLYLLMSVVLVVASGITYAARIPNLYSVPIVTSLVLTCLGLSCWLRSCRWQDDEVKKGWLFAGSVSMALVMGCRPQFFVVTILAFAIFWQQIRKRLFFSKRGVCNTLCVIVPYLVVGTGLMYYNIIRFGSALDFGATYNLTGFDMTHRGFDPERFVLGYWEYLFQPLRFGLRFPYLETVAQHFNMVTDYQGLVVNEPFLGGFFPLNLIGCAVFGLRIMRDCLKRHGLFGIAAVLIVCALIMIGCDVQMVGMTQRYHMDFSLLLMLAAALILLATFHERPCNSLYRALLSSVVALSALCIVIQCFAVIANGRYASLIDVTPRVFYVLKYQLFSMLSIR